MTVRSKELFSSLTQEEWLAGKIHESHRDLIWMDEITEGARNEFGLTRAALDDFVRHVLTEIMKSGARPVLFDRLPNDQATDYYPDPRYVGTEAEIAAKIV
jgi:hypothetical protein